MPDDQPYGDRDTHMTVSQSDPAVADAEAELPESTAEKQAVLRNLVNGVQEQSKSWSELPLVSIGRARELTTLEETRIRYFEELGALQPAKSQATGSANRLYSLADLRRLAALALLIKQHRYRPAAAAAFVKQFAPQIEHGLGELSDLISREGSVVTDGFVLARLMSQLIEAAQMELQRIEHASSDVQEARAECSSMRVIGVMLPMRQIFLDTSSLTPESLRRHVRAMCYPLSKLLVAFDRAAFLGEAEEDVAPLFTSSGRNDSTILFYSPKEPWVLPAHPNHYYSLYTPTNQLNHTLIIVIEAPGERRPPMNLRPTQLHQRLFERLLGLCAMLFEHFREQMLTRNYRYRSDGFPIGHTQATYRQLLETVVQCIFPGDSAGRAALFIPNQLEQPTVLAILAHSNFNESLVKRVKLDLRSDGQGLCGRAYKLREPFFSANTKTDPHVAYAEEEDCCVALAIPLMSGWGLPPFGVLYLASGTSGQTIDAEIAYTAFLLGSILGEQLGRWWLTRLRKAQDHLLHEHGDSIVQWFRSMPERGDDFQRAINALQSLSKSVPTKAPGMHEQFIALVVFDIDKYRQNVQMRSNEPVPLKAQMHVQAAIRKILPDAADYWFKNDHVLLLLEAPVAPEVKSITRRIANQVRSIPPDIQGEDGRSVTITVSAAIKVLTYEDLRDLAQPDSLEFRSQIELIIDDLRMRTAQAAPQTLQILTNAGWQSI